MSDLKTKPNELSLDDYLKTVTDETRLADTKQLITLLGEVTNEKPVMWGASIIGFGSYHYKYASGHSGDWMRIGLSARKEHLVLYGLIYYADETPTTLRSGFLLRLENRAFALRRKRGFSLELTLAVLRLKNNVKLLDSLGKHKRGKGCLYVKKLADIQLDVLKNIFSNAWAKQGLPELGD